MRDVVLAVGAVGAERVLLRGADLHVERGETVVVTGLDPQARHWIAALLTGRIRPRYGRFRSGDVRVWTSAALADCPPATLVLGVEDRGGAGAATLVLTEWRPEEPNPFGECRFLKLSGGQMVPVSPPEQEVSRLPVGELRARVEESLSGAGTSSAAAAVVARVLVDADRRGHHSHGVALLPTYLRRISAGGIRADAQPEFRVLAPSLASVDAKGGLGQIAADVAAEWCAATAAERGIAAVATHTNNHVGMLAAYRWPFQRHRVIGLLLNISGPSVAAPGARRATLGSNALCLVTPNDAEEEPFCVDMATGVVAVGKIRHAASRSVPIPDGWLFDRSGRPTTDPRELDAGGAVPLFGGYKGLCTTLVVEVLAGALAGGLVSPEVAKQRHQPGAIMRCSQMFIGFSVDHFAAAGGSREPAELVEVLRRAVLDGHAVAPERPWFPDQLEEDNARRADRLGVDVPRPVLTELGWDER
ncbi:Ldh family oxidoreductase [Allokutzneria sp. A3M-2-11 16]|uniref:Ldh family oxidoreductase n=1 Tax=Allokutzneria sp. A3M-2-11 16 TaxID=2962043 RepID=UPI0020B7B0CD|nr:Ldh family oxidoreductase [Allokutzneria sp. A3M-2-11 16]MCP3798466.1 Ldh family oxidoreductase [Allokutzneria sp. A3M-2-11 16]